MPTVILKIRKSLCRKLIVSVRHEENCLAFDKTEL